jgi:16S rRNA (cytidine1402-2'-O)-methyltransferase
MPHSRTGTLFLVATPIGNMEDLTFRALRVLREADLIAAEDTRHTSKLLNHYDIRTPTTSLHDHNESARIPGLLARLAAGERVALVSDAGTPSVSDPGFRLVRAAIDAGIRVEAVPGASAVLAGLACSGLPTDAFVFVGFPPPKARAREAWYEALREESRTIVFFEAPHRIRESLASAASVLGDRHVVLARELTKLHEELVRGPISAVLAGLHEPRGEFTVVLSGLPPDAITGDEPQHDDNTVVTAFERASVPGVSRRQALTTVARELKMRPREVYAAIERGRRS